MLTRGGTRRVERRKRPCRAEDLRLAKTVGYGFLDEKVRSPTPAIQVW